MGGTDHTVMTQDGRIIHKKRISKPLKIFQEGPSLRGQNPRDSIGRWTRMNSQTEERLSSCHSPQMSPTYSPPPTPANTQTEEPQEQTVTGTDDTTEPLTATLMVETNPNGIGRGYRKRLIRDRTSPTSSPTMTESSPEANTGTAEWG